MSNKDHGKHYNYEYKGHRIDPYRILRIYGITEPEHQHALKKLLRCGTSVKDKLQDINEVILTLECWKKNIGAEGVTPAPKAADFSFSNEPAMPSNSEVTFDDRQPRMSTAFSCPYSGRVKSDPSYIPGWQITGHKLFLLAKKEVDEIKKNIYLDNAKTDALYKKLLDDEYIDFMLNYYDGKGDRAKPLYERAWALHVAAIKKEIFGNERFPYRPPEKYKNHPMAAFAAREIQRRTEAFERPLTCQEKDDIYTELCSNYVQRFADKDLQAVKEQMSGQSKQEFALRESDKKRLEYEGRKKNKFEEALDYLQKRFCRDSTYKFMGKGFAKPLHNKVSSPISAKYTYRTTLGYINYLPPVLKKARFK